MASTAHISSPNEPFPSPDHLDQATTSHRQGAFTVSTRKLPISKAGPIEHLEKSLGIPVPEMIFGDNLVAITHEPSAWRIEFNAHDALDLVDKTDKNMLQVAYARSWSASREQTSAGIKEVVKPYDWSYTTAYRGTVSPSTTPSTTTGTTTNNDNGNADDGQSSSTTNPTEPSSFSFSTANAPPIPIELLKRRDPILFFDEVVLYESELDDNGISMYSVKLRVHAARMLLLARLFMRLDNVLVRVRDTRVYVDFADEVVIREYTEREAPFADAKRALLMTGLRPDDLTVALRDANQIAELIPKVHEVREAVCLKAKP
ncbi:TIP41-like family-domain-containing protein [Microdochium trichocladiopsis]|uniref:TIP41-like family-domain-containing protein n=1 Tax=Microdochium trichocladiopsis TaxID=1682393 RepID=A0A9P9BUV9_9PEZI|nr:TIP41-like family-domain-containing protein [Microdochium trichocladiopsis]KAH7037874.1 TIP41-like family-domain-containing protein [Microdochium trichocladiopsis]